MKSHANYSWLQELQLQRATKPESTPDACSEPPRHLMPAMPPDACHVTTALLRAKTFKLSNLLTFGSLFSRSVFLEQRSQIVLFRALFSERICHPLQHFNVCLQPLPSTGLTYFQSGNRAEITIFLLDTHLMSTASKYSLCKITNGPFKGHSLFPKRTSNCHCILYHNHDNILLKKKLRVKQSISHTKYIKTDRCTLKK